LIKNKFKILIWHQVADFIFKGLYYLNIKNIVYNTYSLGLWPNMAMIQCHALLSNGHKSQSFCNGRHQIDWHLLSIMAFQPLFRQSLISWTHINGFGSALRIIYTPLMQRSRIISFLTLKPSLHVNSNLL
jgi:hypothetical protein